MSFQKLERPYAGFHPEQVKQYQPKIGMLGQRELTVKKYNGLSDSSTYAMYAWAFLRRNLFYQALVDKGSDILYPLSMWGYQQNAHTLKHAQWEHHCGIWLDAADKPKPYGEDYTKGTAPRWHPLEYLRQFMCSGIGRSAALEDPTTQLQITFDLGHKFAPDLVGLQKQLVIAHDCLEKAFKECRSKELAAQLEMTPPKKSNLRKYLYIADQMTGERSSKKPTSGRAGVSTPLTPQGTQTLKVAEIAKRINSRLGDAEKATTDSVGKDANDAFEYVYRWKCLGLLTLQD
jgi:hypothetical protein